MKYFSDKFYFSAFVYRGYIVAGIFGCLKNNGLNYWIERERERGFFFLIKISFLQFFFSLIEREGKVITVDYRVLIDEKIIVSNRNNSI